MHPAWLQKYEVWEFNIQCKDKPACRSATRLSDLVIVTGFLGDDPSEIVCCDVDGRCCSKDQNRDRFTLISQPGLTVSAQRTQDHWGVIRQTS
jgi:hypothetical protein